MARITYGHIVITEMYTTCICFVTHSANSFKWKRDSLQGPTFIHALICVCVCICVCAHIYIFSGLCTIYVRGYQFLANILLLLIIRTNEPVWHFFLFNLSRSIFVFAKFHFYAHS